MVPGKIETFRFSDLLAAKNVEKRIAGVTVTLEQVRKNNDLWEVRIRVRFDDAGNSLESYRGWILQNDAYLEDPDGKTVPYDNQESRDRDKNEIGLAYLFNSSSRRATEVRLQDARRHRHHRVPLRIQGHQAAVRRQGLGIRD